MPIRRTVFCGGAALAGLLSVKARAFGNSAKPGAAETSARTALIPPRRYDPFPVAEPYRGIYAHGVGVPAGAEILFISGQVGVAPDGTLDPTFKGQCRQAFENLFDVLASANMTSRDLVKMSFFLTRPGDMDALVEIRREFVDGVRPAVTTLFVSGLVSPDWFVEIEAVAARAPLRGLGTNNY